VLFAQLCLLAEISKRPVSVTTGSPVVFELRSGSRKERASRFPFATAPFVAGFIVRTIRELHASSSRSFNRHNRNSRNKRYGRFNRHRFAPCPSLRGAAKTS